MKIALTGIGVISAAGTNLAEALDGFERGERNGGPVTLFPTDLPYPVFEVKNIPRKWEREGLRTLSLALCAMEEALKDADWRDDIGRHRVGVCLGTTVAPQLNDTNFYRAYRGSKAVQMEAVDRFLKGNIAESVARTLKLHGPCSTVVNACASGADAIGVALSWLRNGVCDVALAGGSDELNLVPYCGFASLGIASQSLCSPFDRDRTGLNLGEGAGIFVLETESVARRRGKEPELFCSGYGSASDAYHMTAPRPDGTGLEAALRKALAEAEITPRDVGFVNAHGTSTPDNDRVEGAVLARVFGPEVKVLSTKGCTGHTLGAAGAVEAVFTAAALRTGWLPASAGFFNKDEEIPITPVKEKTSVAERFAVSNSLAFGGGNAALVISRAESY